MYCLQWLIPVLLIPKPLNPALLSNHVMLMGLYLTGFFLERKPCTICTVVFLLALALLCASNNDSASFWGSDSDEQYWAEIQTEDQVEQEEPEPCLEEQVAATVC